MSDIESYEGRVLESYLRQRIREEWAYTSVGGYWNRKGDVEIDIVVLDDSTLPTTIENLGVEERLERYAYLRPEAPVAHKAVAGRWLL